MCSWSFCETWRKVFVVLMMLCGFYWGMKAMEAAITPNITIMVRMFAGSTIFFLLGFLLMIVDSFLSEHSRNQRKSVAVGTEIEQTKETVQTHSPLF